MTISTSAVFLFASLMLSPLIGRSQASYLQQTFESGGNINSENGRLTYTNTGGQVYSGTFLAASGNSANAVPGNASVAAEGTSSFGAVNNTGGGTTTGIVTLAPVVFPVTTGNYLTFRLVSFQTNNNGGMDNATSSNGITVSVAYNGSSAFTPTLQVNGLNGGSIFNYNATGIATTATPINTTSPSLTTVNSPDDRSGGGQTTITGTAGYSTVRLNFGANITQVQVRIQLAANGKTGLFIDDVRIGSSGPLPVELKSFDATAQKNAVLLTWATASEKNNAAFDIQRSSNAVEFETVARVAGQGTSSQSHRYEWLDARPLTGLSYYRLRQLDLDGTESFSPVATMSAYQELTFYPNPVRNLLTVAAPVANMHYRVLNLLGAVLLEGAVDTGAPILDVNSLPMGLYQLEVSSPAGHISRRFTKEM